MGQIKAYQMELMLCLLHVLLKADKVRSSITLLAYLRERITLKLNSKPV